MELSNNSNEHIIKPDNLSNKLVFKNGGNYQTLTVKTNGELDFFTSMKIQRGISNTLFTSLKATGDMIFRNSSLNQILNVKSDGTLDIVGGAGTNGVTIDATGWITTDGRIRVDNTQDVTDINNASIQTDGGLSVKSNALFGGDIKIDGNNIKIKESEAADSNEGGKWTTLGFKHNSY